MGTRQLIEGDHEIEYGAPSFVKLCAEWFGGYDNETQAAADSNTTTAAYLDDFFYDDKEQDLPRLEAAAEKHFDRLMQGVPFPGDDPEWDLEVQSDPGLQLIQKFLDNNN